MWLRMTHAGQRLSKSGVYRVAMIRPTYLFSLLMHLFDPFNLVLHFQTFFLKNFNLLLLLGLMLLQILNFDILNNYLLLLN